MTLTEIASSAPTPKAREILAPMSRPRILNRTIFNLEKTLREFKHLYRYGVFMRKIEEILLKKRLVYIDSYLALARALSR